MNPIIFNCVLLYVLVVLLSVAQSRFRIIKDSPGTFFFLLILTPLVMAGKAKNIDTWTGLTGFEIWGWTLMLACFNAKRIVPKINEGYIYAYTLFHWYLLIDTINIKSFNTILFIIAAISVYPTYLIIKSSFEHKKLEHRNKLILYYWFLFVISFTYADQVALEIIEPIVAIDTIDVPSTLYIGFTAIQLYFIATTFSLLFVAIPVFHLDRSSDKFSVRWKRAMSDWREIVKHKLDNYIEYQISPLQVLIITLGSLFMFYLDFTYSVRAYLIIFYTILLPIAFFYLKASPEENLEDGVLEQTEPVNHNQLTQ